MITLLNGENWAMEEIIANMYDDEFYYNTLNITKALSASSLKDLLNAPENFLKQLKGKKEKSSDALRLGSLVHWLYLEPEKFYSLKFIEADRTNSKVYTEAVKEFGADKVYKVKDQRLAEYWVDILNNKETLKGIRDKCEVEIPMIKTLSGIPIRGKADLLDDNCIYDLKTTRVNPKDFNWWKVRDFDYDLQAFIYCQLFERDYFSFIPINKMNGRPGLVHCSKDVLQSGEDKFYKAIEIYKTQFQGKTLEEISDALSMHLDETIISKPKKQ